LRNEKQPCDHGLFISQNFNSPNFSPNPIPIHSPIPDPDPKLTISLNRPRPGHQSRRQRRSVGYRRQGRTAFCHPQNSLYAWCPHITFITLYIFAFITQICAFGWRRSVVVSALASINVVNRHWALLVLGWVTACGRVNHLGM